MKAPEKPNYNDPNEWEDVPAPKGVNYNDATEWEDAEPPYNAQEESWGELGARNLNRVGGKIAAFAGIPGSIVNAAAPPNVQAGPLKGYPAAVAAEYENIDPEVREKLKPIPKSEEDKNYGGIPTWQELSDKYKNEVQPGYMTPQNVVERWIDRSIDMIPYSFINVLTGGTVGGAAAGIPGVAAAGQLAQELGFGPGMQLVFEFIAGTGPTFWRRLSGRNALTPSEIAKGQTPKPGEAKQINVVNELMDVNKGQYTKTKKLGSKIKVSGKELLNGVKGENGQDIQGLKALREEVNGHAPMVSGSERTRVIEALDDLEKILPEEYRHNYKAPEIAAEGAEVASKAAYEENKFLKALLEGRPLKQFTRKVKKVGRGKYQLGPTKPIKPLEVNASKALEAKQNINTKFNRSSNKYERAYYERMVNLIKQGPLKMASETAPEFGQSLKEADTLYGALAQNKVATNMWKDSAEEAIRLAGVGGGVGKALIALGGGTLEVLAQGMGPFRPAAFSLMWRTPEARKLYMQSINQAITGDKDKLVRTLTQLAQVMKP